MSTLLTRTLSSCALIALVSGGCSGDPEMAVSSTEREPTPGPETAPASQRALAALPYDGALTRADVAEHNLDGQIRVSEQLPAAQSRLLDLYGLRVGMFGHFSDLARGVAFTEAQTLTSPEVADAWLRRASAEASVHRFAHALASLDRADMLGADTARERDMIALALSPGTEAIAERLCDAADARPGYATLTGCASALASLGRYEDADARYAESLERYTDVSPFPVAWVQFQRGVMWGEMADEPEAARRLYEDAVRVLPDYVVANVHLAELEFEAGEYRLASERLERVAEREDPEPLSRLSQFLAEQPASDDERSREAGAEALQRWNALLAGERLAYLDHGAEFFMAAGDDPERALSMALENLENRQTERAVLLAIDAALNAGDEQVACDVATLAPEQARRVSLADVLAELEPSC